MFRSISRRIGELFLTLGTARERKPIATQELDRARFDDHAEKLIASRTDPAAPLTISAVQLIGMRDIEVEFGAAWSQIANKALEITEHVIHRNLGKEDAYTRQDDDTYILCFATLDRNEAERLTRGIVEEIKAQLRRAVPEAAGLKLTHHVTEVNSTEVRERGLSFLEVIAASIDAIKQETADASERLHRMLLEDASVIFSPTWSPVQQRIVLHRCLLDDWTSRSTLQALEIIAEAEELQQAVTDLDCFILGRAINTLHGALHAHSKTVLLVPVNFSSLHQKRLREEYFSLCQRVPQPYRKFLLLEVYGVPASCPISRIIELTQTVQPYCNAVIVSMPLSTAHSLFEIKTNGIYGVSLALDDVRDGDGETLDKYVGAAKAAGLRCFVHGIKTTAQLKAMVEAEVDYASGDAVAPKVETPKESHAWKPLDTGSDMTLPVMELQDLASHGETKAAGPVLRPRAAG